MRNTSSTDVRVLEKGPVFSGQHCHRMSNMQKRGRLNCVNFFKRLWSATAIGGQMAPRTASSSGVDAREYSGASNLCCSGDNV